VRISAISNQRGQLDPKFQLDGVTATIHSSSQKIRRNDLSCGKKNLDRSLFHFVTIRVFDRWTDSFLATRPSGKK